MSDHELLKHCNFPHLPVFTIVYRVCLNKFNSIDKNIFLFSYKVIAIQRHLKVLGIFSRLSIKYKKKSYLKHMPRVLNLLKLNLKHCEFKPIKKILSPLIKFEND